MRKARILIRSGRSSLVWQKLFQKRGVSYQKWHETHYGDNSPFQHQLKSTIKSQNQSILFSIIIPTYNSNPKFLEDAICSVMNQTYSNWELILVDDASKSDLVQLLQNIQKRDIKIKLKLNLHHLGIAGGLNSGIDLCEGKYIGFLDHDDKLDKDALALVAIALKKHPHLKLIYTDEDKIDASSKRFDPYFKPDWNPDLLLSQNYINHFLVYSKEYLDEMGGFRLGFDGAQDWDLLLRSEKFLQPADVFHIPMVLYSWRAIKGSTALAETEKECIAKTQRQSLIAHLCENHIDARLERLSNGYWAVNREVDPSRPKVTIIIPTKNKRSLLETCITSIRTKTTYPNYEILVVDNHSDSETKHYLDGLINSNDFRVLEYNHDFNFAAINNFAAMTSDSSVLVFLNNDTEILTNYWLNFLVANAIRPEIGAVGGMLYYPDSFIQHAGVVLGIGGVAGHIYQGFYKGFPGQFGRALLAQNYSAVTAACMAIEKQKFIDAGGFDQDNLSVAFNDVDLCLKLQDSGYRNLWLPAVELIHKESASRGYEDSNPESQKRFDREFIYMQEKWGKRLLTDPAYNPNLTLDRFDSSLSNPPRTDWLDELLNNTKPPV